MKKITQFFKNLDRDFYALAALIAVFVVSRCILALLGFEIDTRFIPVAWQSADAWLLEHELLKTIWFLHSQPPLYNFFVGVCLKLFGQNNLIALQLVHHVLGLILALCMYAIIKGLTKHRLLAFGVTVLFVLSPSVILFEGLFFYDYPVMVMLTAVAYLFYRFARTQKTSHLFYFFLTAALLVLTRRVFHLLWFLFFFVMLLYIYRKEWKRIVFAAFIPLLLILFWSGKNYYYFGKFDTSSWSGMGFFKVATYAMTDAERQELFDAGIVSENIFHGKDPFQSELDFSGADAYPASVVALPIVGDMHKRNGATNFNHYAYIDLSQELMGEFKSIVAHKPSAYIKGTVVAGIIYFAPASNYFVGSENQDTLDKNYPIVQKYNRWFDRIVYWQPLALGGDSLKMYVANRLDVKPTEAWRLLSPGILLIAMHIFSVFYALGLLFLNRKSLQQNRALYLTVSFLMLNILYVTAVGILAELGENQRHRFMVEPMVWILLAVFVNRAILKKNTKVKQVEISEKHGTDRNEIVIK